jgi:integrating conjugative element protein (TIGR03757 family)
MKIKCVLWPALLLFSLNGYAEIAVTKVEVFVEHPLAVIGIPNTDITVFDLSRKDAVKATAPHFPPNPETAQTMAKAWLESPEGKAFVLNLKAAYAGHSKMIAYEVLKVPAIVFDKGKYVIYGTTDVMQAVRDYDDYIKSHKKSLVTAAGDANE